MVVRPWSFRIFFQWCHHHRYIIALLWVIFLPQLIQAKDYDLCI